MKTLKFKTNLIQEILAGTKTVTWRLFDDKDLKVRDQFEFVDASDGKVYGEAIIVDVKEKRIKELQENELHDHEYENLEDMLVSHRKYYGEKVNLDTMVKMIKFKLISRG